MRTLALLLALASTVFTKGQHCGYDFASIIVVHPHLEGDTHVVKDLRITLLDSTNLPVTFHGKAWHLFRPNTEREACAQWQAGFAPGYKGCFPFAKDNYVLVIPRGMDTAKMKVLVQDDRPTVYADHHRQNRVDPFRMQVVPLTAFDSYPLCGTYNDVVYPRMEGRPDYAPVEVVIRSN